MRKLTNTELKHVYGGGILGGILGCNRGSRSHHTRSYSHHGSSGCGTRTRTRTGSQAAPC